MDSRVTSLVPSTTRMLALGVPVAFLLLVAVAKLPDPWWQRLLGPLFAALGFFLWVALRHVSRHRPVLWRAWLSLAVGASAFFLLQAFFPPIAPPFPDPFVERIPSRHFDWHTVLVSWAPWTFFVHAFASFSRHFSRAIANSPVQGVAALIALIGLCATIPGVLLIARNLDFAIQFPIILLAVSAFSVPMLAKLPPKA